MRALVEGTDPTDIYPWKVWAFKNSVDVRQAMAVWDLPSHTAELLSLGKMFSEFADELTTPRFMQGDNSGLRGAGKTARGLSMLMGAANIILKDLVKAFDDNITSPFIKALYHWNMQFNPKEEIKGDFDIIARGSSALIAKEIQAERMTQAVAVTDNPRFQGRVKDDELLQEIFKSMDLDTEILRDDKEYQDWQQQQMVMAASARPQLTSRPLSPRWKSAAWTRRPRLARCCSRRNRDNYKERFRHEDDKHGQHQEGQKESCQAFVLL